MAAVAAAAVAVSSPAICWTLLEDRPPPLEDLERLRLQN